MSRQRNIGPFARTASLFIALVMITASAATHATEAPKADANAATATCRGKDMLDEMKLTSPDLHKRVIEDSDRVSNTEAMLWSVSKDGVEQSYLFGTMHLSDSRISTLSPTVLSAIGKSKTVALEVADLSDAAMSGAMAKAADMIIYTDGRSLQKSLDESEFNKVKDVVSKSGMPGEFAGVLKPWLVNMLLALSDCERRKVAAGAPVLDMKVAEVAQQTGKPVVGLETIQDQLSALANVPEDQQIQMLKVGLKYADRADDMVETLVQLYLNRKLGAAMPFQIALAAKHNTPASAFEGFKTSLLVDRNAKMRDAALPLLENGAAFIAIGALHLSGDTGLIALLRDKGFDIKPVE